MIAAILNGDVDDESLSAFFKKKDKQGQKLEVDSDMELLEIAKKIINDFNNEFFEKLIDHQQNIMLNMIGFIFHKLLPENYLEQEKVTIHKDDIVITQEELRKLNLVTVLNFRRLFNLIKCEKQEHYLNCLVTFDDLTIDNYAKDYSFQNQLNSGFQNKFLQEDYKFTGTQLEMIKDISVQDLNKIMTKGPGDGYNIAIEQYSLTEIKNNMFITNNQFMHKYGQNSKYSQENDEKIRNDFMNPYFTDKDVSARYRPSEITKRSQEAEERELIIENLLQLADNQVSQLGISKEELLAKIKGENKNKDKEIANLKEALNRREIIISNTRNSLTKEILQLKELLNNKNPNANRASSVDNKNNMVHIMGKYDDLGPSRRTTRSRRDSNAFEDLDDQFAVDNQNDKLMINHLEKKIKDVKLNYKKKYNKARDQLQELEKKYNDLLCNIEREKKLKPENMQNKLMEDLSNNKIKLWRMLQDIYGDNWQDDILLKKEEDLTYGINYDAIDDSCCKRVLRVGMKKISPSNTDPVYTVCIDAFKSKITKLNEEINYKDQLVKDLSCVENNQNYLEELNADGSNSRKSMQDNNTNNTHDRYSKAMRIVENKLNVLYKEFMNVSATKMTLAKQNIVLEEKLKLKQGIIEDFQNKLGLYKEAKGLNRDLEKLDQIDPENFSQIPLSRIWDSVVSDYLVQYVLLHNIPKIRRMASTQTATENYDPEIMDTIIKESQNFFRQSHNIRNPSPENNRFICMKCKDASKIGTDSSVLNLEELKSAQVSSLLEVPDAAKKNFKRAKKYATNLQNDNHSVSRMSQNSRGRKSKRKIVGDNASSKNDLEKSSKSLKYSSRNIVENSVQKISQRSVDKKIDLAAEYILDKFQTPDVVDINDTKKIEISPFENMEAMHKKVKAQISKTTATPSSSVQFNKIHQIKELREKNEINANNPINKNPINKNPINNVLNPNLNNVLIDAGTQTFVPVDARDQLSYTTGDQLNNSVIAMTAETTKPNLVNKRQNLKQSMKLNLHDHPNMIIEKQRLPKKSYDKIDSSNGMTNISFNTGGNTRNPNNVSLANDGISAEINQISSIEDREIDTTILVNDNSGVNIQNNSNLNTQNIQDNSNLNTQNNSNLNTQYYDNSNLNTLTNNNSHISIQKNEALFAKKEKLAPFSPYQKHTLSEIEEKTVIKQNFRKRDIVVPKNRIDRSQINRGSIWDRLYNDSFDRQEYRKNQEVALENLLGSKWTMELVEKNQLYYDINGVGLFFDNINGKTFLDLSHPDHTNQNNYNNEYNENLFLTNKVEQNPDIRTMPAELQHNRPESVTNNRELYNQEKVKNSRARQNGRAANDRFQRNAIRPSTAIEDCSNYKLSHHVNSFSVDRSNRQKQNLLDISGGRSELLNTKQNYMENSAAQSVDYNRQRKNSACDYNQNRSYNKKKQKDSSMMVPVVPLADGRLGIALDDLSTLLSKVQECAKNMGDKVHKCTQTNLVEEDYKAGRTKKAGNLFGEMIDKHRENLISKKKHSQTINSNKTQW